LGLRKHESEGAAMNAWGRRRGQRALARKKNFSSRKKRGHIQKRGSILFLRGVIPREKEVPDGGKKGQAPRLSGGEKGGRFGVKRKGR